MNDLRRPLWRYLPIALGIGIVLHFWIWPSLTALPAPDLDIASILSRTPQHLSHQIYTETKENEGQSLAKIGTPGAYIELPNNEILDARTLEPMSERLERSSFNLAILALPGGSAWDYVGVARGPLRRRDFMQLNGHGSIEQVMIAFGLNYTTEKGLHRVTLAQTLDIQNIPREACEVNGMFVATYGTEDARLFWTDAGTPGMTFGRQADSPKTCRVVGFVRDLRAIYAPLADALHVPRGGPVKAYDAIRVPGQSASFEMQRLDAVRISEKNWAPFYPGALPNPSAVIPHFGYNIAPVELLRPVRNDLRKVYYEPTDFDPQLARCAMEMHPSYPGYTLHQATPWYRLTLGERGKIQPTAGNTVLFTIVHAKLGSFRYVKFVMTYSVDSPHRLLSVGPGWEVNGLPDHDIINFSLALAPLPPRVRSDKSSGSEPWLPSHLFLDDEVLFTLGHQDSAMAYSVLQVEDLVARQKAC